PPRWSVSRRHEQHERRASLWVTNCKLHGGQRASRSTQNDSAIHTERIEQRDQSVCLQRKSHVPVCDAAQIPKTGWCDEVETFLREAARHRQPLIEATARAMNDEHRRPFAKFR